MRKNFDLVGKLIQAARRVRLNAYAPYSKYQVGAAVLTEHGNIYAGCNVESVDYDGTHAEEAALAAMVAAGERAPRLIVIFGGLEGQEPKIVMPCGKCRQKLLEFHSLLGFDFHVATEIRDGDVFGKRHIRDLLPDSFGPADIGMGPKKRS